MWYVIWVYVENEKSDGAIWMVKGDTPDRAEKSAIEVFCQHRTGVIVPTVRTDRMFASTKKKESKVFLLGSLSALDKFREACEAEVNTL